MTNLITLIACLIAVDTPTECTTQALDRPELLHEEFRKVALQCLLETEAREPATTAVVLAESMIRPEALRPIPSPVLRRFLLHGSHPKGHGCIPCKMRLTTVRVASDMGLKRGL